MVDHDGTGMLRRDRQLSSNLKFAYHPMFIEYNLDKNSSVFACMDSGIHYF